MALCVGAQAQAQDAAPVMAAADAAAPTVDDITVTGSRIVRDGYSAPTPVSVISTKELQAEAPASIADFAATLPAIRGSQNGATNSGRLSAGEAGISALNLRNLGAVRTLVLFDGQRSVASSATGLVDTNTFPQALVERVEVVTGGASSAYGSDAVAGVVNFILDRKYTGVKGSYEYGVTTYGDVPNHKVTLTAGMPFGGGKGHILVSGEYFNQQGKSTIDRKWNSKGHFMMVNPAWTATNGQPYYLVSDGIGVRSMTPGGLVTNGPAGIQDTYFGTIDPATGRATTGQFAAGAPVARTSGQWMLGGDWQYSLDGFVGTNSLMPDEERYSGFGRVSWEFSPALQVYAQMAYSHYNGLSYYQQTPSTGVSIQLDNAFLPAAFLSRVNAYNATVPAAQQLRSITIGTTNSGIPAAGSDNTRQVYRYVLGAEGGFEALSREWKWDAYYQKGIAKTNESLINTWNTARMALAQDAVFAPAGNSAGIAAGTIVCRSTLASPNNGCVPINRIGVGGASPAAIDYIFNNGDQPLRKQTLKQDVAAFNLSTADLFETWAGPVSIAFGGEWRKEQVNGSVDPQFASGWLYGNYLVTKGSYNVKEAYLETVVPLLRGMDLNGAVRVTDYSTSGTVSTWKLGLTYQVIDDIKLRGTVSRDIRAPNLNELFAPGIRRTNTVQVLQPNGTVRSDEILEQVMGNPGLKPEVAKTYGVGVVLTPRFLPGFAMSVDYYAIRMTGAIGSLSAANITDLCFRQNIASACANIVTADGGALTPASDISIVNSTSLNYSETKSRGIDFEASYRRPVLAGNVTVRALATRYISVYTNNGIGVPSQAAGQNSGSTPDWSYRLSAGYDQGPFSISVVGRGVSGGVYNTQYVDCEASCPARTQAQMAADNGYSINNNRIPGAFYVDLNTSYGFEIGNSKAEAFLSIKNIFNRDPVLVAGDITANNTPSAAQTNRQLYDVLGRVFRLGVRFSY
ncbi:TonB-dependent receptor domain-containing protein [Sphingomonas quercus]|nr:TonB-dependent receptor [Sphingomonas quercus]